MIRFTEDNMSGWEALQQMKKIEERANILGFKLARSRFNDHHTDTVGLMPKDEDSLPPYSRDAELFNGTLHQVSMFLRGIEWARDYDFILNVSNPKKREQQEQKERNRQLAKAIKES